MTDKINEETPPGTSIGNASVEFPPTARFVKNLKAVDVYDNRRRKDKTPKILKRFKKYFGEDD